jgi:hypothetical protein
MSDKTLAALPQKVLNPITGEVVALSDPADRLAGFVEDVRDLEARLRFAKQAVAEEMHRRFDRERKWSLTEGDFKLSGESDAEKWEWDAEALDRVLDRLVQIGKITPAAAEAAVETSVSYKVKAQGLNALRKSPELAPLIEACGRVVPLDERRRKLSVSRVESLRKCREGEARVSGGSFNYLYAKDPVQILDSGRRDLDEMITELEALGHLAALPAKRTKEFRSKLRVLEGPPGGLARSRVVAIV